MRCKQPLLTGIVLLAVAACARTEPAAVSAEAAARPRAGAPPATARTQRWPADAPLRAGMARISVATDALAHGQHGHLDARQVAALADELQSAVNDIIAGCKLEPAADAALHPLLGRVLSAARALREAPAATAQHGELREVLRLYPQLFEDPGWPVDRPGP